MSVPDVTEIEEKTQTLTLNPEEEADSWLRNNGISIGAAGSQSSKAESSGENPEEEATPSRPPRRRERKKSSPSSPRLASNGLPPTPKVHMGACFSKVFNGCPLGIHCTASWVHPETRDQHILIGAEEGLYTLNLNELHEAFVTLLFPRRTLWMVVVKDVLMTLSGKTVHLYRHDLVGLHSSPGRSGNRFPVVDRLLVPRKMHFSQRVPETRNCLRACVGKNPYNGYRYLCGATPSGVFLMQWYDPLNKFMLLKHYECRLPHPLMLFEMLMSPDVEYPLLCVGVRRGYSTDLRLELLRLTATDAWLDDASLPEDNDGTATVLPNRQALDVVCVTQMSKDTILVAYDSTVQIIDLRGNVLRSRNRAGTIKFSFRIEAIVCLSDSVLAFHRHGMQGRSLRDGSITQEISDVSRMYRLLGTDKIVVLSSRSLTEVNASNSDDGVNLHVLTGHEETY